MDELIGRLTQQAGVDAGTAQQAVRIIFSFLYQEGPSDKMVELAGKIPGAAAYIEPSEHGTASSLSGLGGLMGGGAMAVLGKLQALGLGMGEIQGITQETVAFAREKAGASLVNEVVAAIPGLSQFV